METKPQPAAAPAAAAKEARELFVQLVKGLKSIGLFPSSPNRFPAFMEPAHKLLTAFLAAHGRLAIEVGPETFDLDGKPVLSASASEHPPFLFHHSGQLIFMPGVTLDELCKLALAALGDVESRRNHKDMVGALTAAALSHIQYAPAGGPAPAEVREAPIDPELLALVDELARRAKAQGLSLNDPDKASPSAVPPALVQRVQAELSFDREWLLPKLCGVVLALLETELVENPGGLPEVPPEIIDWMLAQGNFGALNQLLVDLPARSKAPALAALPAKLAEPQRLAVVLDALRAKPPEAPEEVVRYLTALPPEVGAALLAALDTVELPESRQAICDALAVVAHDPAPLVARLETGNPAMVRDMLYVLDKLQSPDKAKLLTTAFHSPNPEVRLGVLDAVVSARGPGARAMLSQALVDPEARLRSSAARGLLQLDPVSGVQELLRVLRSPQFAKRAQEEQLELYDMIGASGEPDAEAFLARAFLQDDGGLLQRRKVAKDKLLALAGLSACGTIAVYRLLQEAVKKGIDDPELLAETSKTVTKLHAQLLGKPPPPPKGGAA